MNSQIKNVRIIRFTGWIISKVTDTEMCKTIMEDLEFEFAQRNKENGKLAAYLHHIWQCLIIIITLKIENTTGGFSMFKNYIKITLRNIKSSKLYSALNIIGLAVGLASFILIALYVQFELSFDKNYENTDRIYRVVRDIKTYTPAPLGQALKDNFPEFEAVTRIIQEKNMLVSHEQNHFIEEEFYWAGSETFKIFTIPFISGDPETALNNPLSIVISQKTAKKYFGNEDPLGKILIVNNQTNFTVKGVFSDMPANSHFIMDVVVPYKDYFQVHGGDITHWGGHFSCTYSLLKEGVDPKALESKIHPVIEIPLYEQYGYPKPYHQMYFLQPITEIHLHSHRMQEISINNDIKYIYLFSSIAFLILFIACINYMNLATARSIRRSREVGMRKVVGAQRKQLVLQFLGESVTMTILALILSILIILLVLPAFNNLVERPLSFDPVSNPQLFIGLTFIVVFVGLFAGSYPAMSVSGFKPITVLSGVFTRSSKGNKLRNSLVVFQFSITIILFICTLTIQKQLSLIRNIDVGYNKEQIITLTTRDKDVRKNIEIIKNELNQSPDVTAVSTSSRLPNDIETFISRDINKNKPDELITIFYNSADYDYVDLYDIEIVEGRNFSRDFASDANGVYLINEAFIEATEWESPVGMTFSPWRDQSGEIVGVMKDFHFHSLHSPVDPLFIRLNPNAVFKMSIKINSSNIPKTIDYVKSLMKKFSSNYPFEYSFFDEVFDRAYHTEQRMVNIFSSFAFLAIIIACLGLFGLSTFAVEQRTKEIGIRKVVGASVPRVAMLLSKEFIRWVVLANLIAWPIAYFAMNKWLQNFVYRINQNLSLFMFAALIALVIAVLTVSMQSIKAAFAKPADSLKYE